MVSCGLFDVGASLSLEVALTGGQAPRQLALCVMSPLKHLLQPAAVHTEALSPLTRKHRLTRVSCPSAENSWAHWEGEEKDSPGLDAAGVGVGWGRRCRMDGRGVHWVEQGLEGERGAGHAPASGTAP